MNFGKLFFIGSTFGGAGSLSTVFLAAKTGDKSNLTNEVIKRMKGNGNSKTGVCLASDINLEELEAQNNPEGAYQLYFGYGEKKKDYEESEKSCKEDEKKLVKGLWKVTLDENTMKEGIDRADGTNGYHGGTLKKNLTEVLEQGKKKKEMSYVKHKATELRVLISVNSEKKDKNGTGVTSKNS